MIYLSMEATKSLLATNGWQTYGYVIFNYHFHSYFRVFKLSHVSYFSPVKLDLGSCDRMISKLYLIRRLIRCVYRVFQIRI